LGGCGGPRDALVVDVDTAELAGGCVLMVLMT